MAEEQKKKKRPTAEKRDLQNNKRKARNKTFKSSVHTAMRKFEKALSESDQEGLKTSQNLVYSLMDKGVKRGIFKPNKASRTKAKVAAKVAAQAS